jgi:hypothetical protein
MLVAKHWGEEANNKLQAIVARKDNLMNFAVFGQFVESVLLLGCVFRRMQSIADRWYLTGLIEDLEFRASRSI